MPAGAPRADLRGGAAALVANPVLRFDCNAAAINGLHADIEAGAFAAFAKFDISLRNMTDLAGYTARGFQFVILNNVLHEVCAEDLPRLLSDLNELLARPDGRLCIVDMEKLPDEEIEPWAINYRGSEVAQFLRAGGFSPVPCTHPKRVVVYRVTTGPADLVDKTGIELTLRDILTEKRAGCVREASHYRRSRIDTPQAMMAGCGLAAVELALHHLTRRAGS